ncbi:ATPase of HSP90 chaperone/DNA topoisomerase II/histidine kinase [Glarea lozoyensis ATCC 20868]|uniref:ATPase of HSP90 chaperone/DNA topoisomerase II/histidine kinase n=1 Tax=Glarea lozoyensis (strain ATCC 20868 / MF5171) TaxID=1116229 RepID=S3CIK0_GLAL2|nr:ATPase of HSP90 chaperone/DNA topoisomerase II/histidine kinase [Glarea lozoyensis ATCC 20868]EPE26292.1 ATPase of HSP90 chaperone/DNA topoisomerase II/histidine kinase [Glarea lozoyensis ATCC 20868]
MAPKPLCLDYPAGFGVLRELLQNADDAGAREVRFHLDDRSYTTTGLMHEALAQYQGPALLAYNSGIFQDDDFKSLSSLGDSLKFLDGSKTGKFGRGFNTVYNWTDSPSIVSRDQFSILDPHMEWSRDLGEHAGGPRYNFVADCEDTEMQNHMSVFKPIITNPCERFDGTVIRIPLRTEEQSRRSEISGKHPTVLEVQEVLQNFASEFGKGGLLYLKNVESITISSSSIYTKMTVLDIENARSHKRKVLDGINSALENSHSSFHHSFKLGLQLQTDGLTTETAFFVHHSLPGDLMSDEMRRWAEQEKQFPWVAVAAQIYPRDNEPIGSLSTVVPLPIQPGQPVHIHGAFHLSPDRQRLTCSDREGLKSKDDATKWNDWLFHSCIPSAWVQLSDFMAQHEEVSQVFQWWPQESLVPYDYFNGVLDDFLRIINEKALPIWPTEAGYMTATQSFLSTAPVAPLLRAALGQAKVPVVYSLSRLLSRTKQYFVGRYLSAESLSLFFKQNPMAVAKLDSNAKVKILEYLLQEETHLEKFYFLNLFPFKSGEFGPLELERTFIDRDEAEAKLFCHQTDSVIDLGQLPKRTVKLLRDQCGTMQLRPYISYRPFEYLSVYSLQFVFAGLPTEQDMVMLNEEASTFVHHAWAWIMNHGVEFVQVASELWLIPLTNGQYRKVVPRSSAHRAFNADSSVTGKFMKDFHDKESSVNPLIDSRMLGSVTEALPTLMQASFNNPSLRIADAGNIIVFVEWLKDNTIRVSKAPPAIRERILEIIASSLRLSVSNVDRQLINGSIKYLTVFRKVFWSKKGKKWTLDMEWTNLDAVTTSIGLSEEKVCPIPEVTDVQFIHVPPFGNLSRVNRTLSLLGCLNRREVVEKFVIPNWNTPQTQDMPESCKLQLVKLIFSQFSCLSTPVQSKLRSLAIVPAQSATGSSISKLSLATDLIDPSASDLLGMFFDDEQVRPDQKFFAQYTTVIRGIGLKRVLDYEMFLARVQKFASCNQPISEINKRVCRLLGSYGPSPTASRISQAVNIKTLEWIPVQSLQAKELVLCAPSKCRGGDDRPLVDSQMPIFEGHVGNEWMTELGWRETISQDVLLGQLRHGIENKNRTIVDAVLTYIYGLGNFELWQTEINDLPFVFTGNSHLITPSKAFAPSRTRAANCDGLYPYAANVDKKFWEDHKPLLQHFGVREGPLAESLVTISTQLATKDVLDDEEVCVAVKLAKLASWVPRSDLTGFRIVSDTKKMIPVEDISYPNSGTRRFVSDKPLTHPDIPQSISEKLKIAKLTDRIRDEELEISDEYEQQEDMTTSIVRTLESYVIGSTFNEYLANADDTTTATVINWLLDTRTHPQEGLYHDDLKAAQGPALLVHNDDVFSEQDFKGFQNVGSGSKTENVEVIGQFGRGSQTMYHWTDTPIILSGEYLVILDAQRRVLGLGDHGNPKSGIKVKIKLLRERHPNQLIAFEALWGYSLDLDEYPGTIFRFPLRPSGVESKFRLKNPDLSLLGVKTLLESYFEVAKVSLLFVRKIKYIDFTIHGNEKCEWSVTRKDSVTLANSWSQNVEISHEQSCGAEGRQSGKDTYKVAIEDIEAETKDLPYTSTRVMKRVECGFAAKICATINGKIIEAKADRPHVFKTLPLTIRSDFNVAVHATFDISGDRRTFVVSDPMNDTDGSAWNRYLLSEKLPEILLQFLSVLADEIGQKVFDFWPQREVPTSSHLSLLSLGFWEKLTGCNLSLFPSAQPSLKPSKRQKLKIYTIDTAVFDDLTEKVSEALAPLLLTLQVKLVRRLPEYVSKQLRKIDGAQFVDGSFIRRLSKTTEFRTALEGMLSYNPSVLDAVLRIALPKDEDQQLELDGCHIIPLLDGTLGTLRVGDQISEAKDYFLAPAKTQKLFKFASSLMVSESYDKAFRYVLKARTSNLKALELCYVDELMELRPEPKAVSKQEDNWLRDFWKFWDSNLDTSEDVELDHFGNVLKSRTGDVESYRRLSEMDTLPAIIEPTEEEHLALIRKIPGLVCFDRTIMPKSLKDSSSLHESKDSISRLFKAFHELATSSSLSVGDFLQPNLLESDFEVLRDLIERFCKMNKSTTSTSTVSDPILQDLRTIPLWKSADPNVNSLLSSVTAKIAEQKEFLVSWIKNGEKFVSHDEATTWNDCMEFLKVKRITTAQLIDDYIFPLPSAISKADLRTYGALISALADFINTVHSGSNVDSAIRNNNLAVDGNLDITHVSNLFEAEDEVFRAAFRTEEPTKLLHETVRKHTFFWRRAGIRHRVSGRFAANDYLECLNSIARRLSGPWDSHLENDADVVLRPLCNPSSSTDGFDLQAWSRLTQKKVFISDTRFGSEPEFRRLHMRTIASSQPVLCLSEVVSHYHHAAVCWSQTPFPINTPSKEVFHRVKYAGKPPVEMVWRHLEYLHSICSSLDMTSARDFFKDLQATYIFLQNHQDTAKTTFNSHLHGLPLFLNTNSLNGQGITPFEIQSSWIDIDHLVLASSVDAGRLQAVRPGLRQYENLLKKLGCRAINYPIGIQISPPQPGLLNGHTGMKGFQEMRKKQQGCDVTFRTEGREIKAHRAVLANISEKWRQQFFAYQELIDEEELQILEEGDEVDNYQKLLSLLEIHKAANYQIIMPLAEYIEYMILLAIKIVINIDNVDTIREKAGLAQAEKVEQFCVSFYEANKDTLRFKGE